MTDSYLRSARRHWWLILLVAIIAAVAAYLESSSSPERFGSAGRMVVTPAEGLDLEGVAQSLSSLDRQFLVPTLAEVLTSDQILADALSEAGLEGRGERFAVSSVHVPESSVVEYRVEGPAAQPTADVATAIAIGAQGYFEDAYQLYAVDVLDEATVPDAPFAPVPRRDALIAAIAGAGIGFFLGLARDFLAGRGATTPGVAVVADEGDDDAQRAGGVEVPDEDQWLEHLRRTFGPEITLDVSEQLRQGQR